MHRVCRFLPFCHLKGTSTIVCLGSIENITAPPRDTRRQFFHATLLYLGIVN
jgi:hypothetical protein